MCKLKQYLPCLKVKLSVLYAQRSPNSYVDAFAVLQIWSWQIYLYYFQEYIIFNVVNTKFTWQLSGEETLHQVNRMPGVRE